VKSQGGGDARKVREKAERMARARRARGTLWRSLLHVGVLGWLLILPALAGAVLGRVLARSTGMRWLAMAGLLLGLLIGGLTVFWNVRRAIHEEDDVNRRDQDRSGQ
jgi:hypothetical protein